MWLKKFYYRHKVATRYGLSLLLLTIFFYSFTRLSCFYYLTKVYGEDKEYFPDDVSFSGKRDTTTILTLIEEGKREICQLLQAFFHIQLNEHILCLLSKIQWNLSGMERLYLMILSVKFYLKQLLKIGTNGVGEVFFCMITSLKVVLMVVK